MLQSTGGVELRRHDGHAACGAVAEGGGKLLSGRVTGVWGGGCVCTDYVEREAEAWDAGPAGWSADYDPALFALATPKQDVVVEAGFGKTMHRVWSEFKATFLRWRAIPYSLVVVFPMSSGAAVGLLPGVAREYGVNGEHVAWVNGLGGALLMAGGSLAATLIPARVRAAVAYLSVGLVNAGALGVLWLGPLLPSTYYVGLTLYLFTIGTGYAMFTAVVLEFLGRSGKSGSGRYSIINSLGNVPVLYMLVLDGWGGEKWGARGLAGTEAVVGAVGALILLAYFVTRKKDETAPGGTAS